MARKATSYRKSYLRQWRESLGLTQEQVVARLDAFGTDGTARKAGRFRARYARFWVNLHPAQFIC